MIKKIKHSLTSTHANSFGFICPCFEIVSEIFCLHPKTMVKWKLIHDTQSAEKWHFSSQKECHRYWKHMHRCFHRDYLFWSSSCENCSVYGTTYLRTWAYKTKYHWTYVGKYVFFFLILEKTDHLNFLYICKTFAFLSFNIIFLILINALYVSLNKLFSVTRVIVFQICR